MPDSETPGAAAGDGPGTDLGPADPHGWSRDVAALLAERRSMRRRSMEVELPPNMSATALTELADDPVTLARRIRRPVPQAPTPLARRGTAFHAWLERFFTGSALLEVTDLPGANDSGMAPEPELEELKAKFLRSAWAKKVPFEIELPFAMIIGGQPVRGRVDAVFRDDDGGCTVVDWKTGRPPATDRRRAVTVQLAVYRLAVAEMLDLPLSKVRAEFVYIQAGESFAPIDLPDAAGLAAMIADATADQAS
jgi:DNA helicase-2/ATP-dependent DNA helicase PcrA